MIYLMLFLSFAKIGTFAFGGGLSTITLISHEVLVHQWLTQKEFVDILTVSQMVPGPFSTNVAAYIGIKQAGIVGGIVSVVGVSLPSFIIVLALVSLLNKLKNNALIRGLVYGLLPITVSLIFYSAFIITQVSLTLYSEETVSSLILLTTCFLLRWLTKINVLTLIVFGVITGLIIF